MLLLAALIGARHIAAQPEGPALEDPQLSGEEPDARADEGGEA